MNNRVYIIIIVLLLLVSGYLGLKLNQKSGQVVETQSSLDASELERERLELDLEKMKLSYDTLQTDNSMLRAEMDGQRIQIEELLNKVKNKNWSISKLKKEAETLREIMKGYVVTIDSLNTLNQNLMAENEQMKSTVETVTSENKNLLERQENMEKIIETGQVLQTASISATAIKLRSSGKQVETTNSRRAEMIKTCFTVIENRIAKKGTKTLYLKIIDPNGKVMQSSEAGGEAELEGEVQSYSIKRDIDYNNQEMDVCIFYSVQEEPAEGDYKVFLYDGSTQIASTDFSLR
jgi:hypothetical protein